MKPGTGVGVDVDVDAGVLLVLSVDDFDVVPDTTESSGGPGKSRLLGESNSLNGSVGVLFIVNFVVVGPGLGLIVVVIVVCCPSLRLRTFV